MGIDLLDVAFRLERTFGVRIGSEEFIALGTKNTPYDIRVGDLFDFIRGQLRLGGILDSELDAETLWPLFQRDISDALGVDLKEVTKDQGLIHDLGAQ